MRTRNRDAVGITGIGMHLPERVLTNAELERLVDTTDDWIVERTGIRERRIAGPGESTSTMAEAAARDALERAEVDPAELDLIVVATVTPDMAFPSTACLLQDRLGARRAAAVDMAAACPGFVYGLVLAGQTVVSGLYRKVLVVGAETLSRITDYTDRATCVLFGDAAGAAVLEPVSPGRGLIASHLRSEGEGADHLSLPAGGSLRPPSHETIDAGLHYLKMSGREVFKFAVRVMESSTRQVLGDAGLAVGDVDHLVPHQANARIIDTAIERLGIDRAKVLINLERCGNTSTATIPTALAEADRQGRLRDDDLIVFTSFGAGLVYGACALRWGR